MNGYINIHATIIFLYTQVCQTSFLPQWQTSWFTEINPQTTVYCVLIKFINCLKTELYIDNSFENSAY